MTKWCYKYSSLNKKLDPKRSVIQRCEVVKHVLAQTTKYFLWPYVLFNCKIHFWFTAITFKRQYSSIIHKFYCNSVSKAWVYRSHDNEDNPAELQNYQMKTGKMKGFSWCLFFLLFYLFCSFIPSLFSHAVCFVIIQHISLT